MMMNEYEIRQATRMHAGPLAQQAADTLYLVMEWTNDNSDGWPYWAKPRNAAAKLMTLVQRSVRDGHEPTSTELAKALVPLRSFATRQGSSELSAILA